MGLNSWAMEERLGLEDLIPDAEGTEAWERLDAEEQRDRLLSLIGELPPAQRQAFLLYALEGYDTAEIAMLQDRPESQVKADIETARQGAARTPAGRADSVRREPGRRTSRKATGRDGTSRPHNTRNRPETTEDQQWPIER